MNWQTLALCALAFTLGYVTHATITEPAQPQNQKNHRSPTTRSVNADPTKVSAGTVFEDSKINPIHAEATIARMKSESGQDPSSTTVEVNNRQTTKPNTTASNITTDEEFKRKVKLAEIKKQRDQMDRQIKAKNYHYAMWSAIRLYKLAPSEDLKIEMKALAEDLYTKASKLESAGNILEAGDYYEALRWGYMGDLKQPFDLDDIAARHDTIRANPEYFTQMQTRADTQMKTVKGHVNYYPPFWEYFELANNDRKKLKEPIFRGNFIASLKHLVNHYKYTGDYEQLEHSTNYFRKAFPELTQGTRVHQILKSSK